MKELKEQESTLTIKWAVVVGSVSTVVSAVLVFVITVLMSHASRITVLETNYTHVCASLSEIKGTLGEIKKNQEAASEMKKPLEGVRK